MHKKKKKRQSKEALSRMWRDWNSPVAGPLHGAAAEQHRLMDPQNPTQNYHVVQQSHSRARAPE